MFRMRLSLALVLSSTAYSAALYPTNTTYVNLNCEEATFDPAGAVSGSPYGPTGCTIACLRDHLSHFANLSDVTGQVIGLASDNYAGCSFPAEYVIRLEKATVPCLYTSAAMGIRGFFTAVDSNVMVTRENVVGARIFVKQLPVLSTIKDWMIYESISDIDSCKQNPGSMNDSWIIGNGTVGPMIDMRQYLWEINMTNYYQSHDAENGKMYMFLSPGGNTTIDDTCDTNSVTTKSNGPMQVGVSAKCGAITDCTSCVSESCHWCQLTVNGVTSGLCGVTESQCYEGYQSPYGSVGWFRDQCTTPVSSTTTSTTTTPTTTTFTTVTTKFRRPTTAGAGSAMMVSVVGVVLLGAALAL